MPQLQQNPNTVVVTRMPYGHNKASRSVLRYTPISRLKPARPSIVKKERTKPARIVFSSRPPKSIVMNSTGMPTRTTHVTNVSRAASLPSTISRLVSSDDCRKSRLLRSFSSAMAPPA